MYGDQNRSREALEEDNWDTFLLDDYDRYLDYPKDYWVQLMTTFMTGPRVLVKAIPSPKQKLVDCYIVTGTMILQTLLLFQRGRCQKRDREGGKQQEAFGSRGTQVNSAIAY